MLRFKYLSLFILLIVAGCQKEGVGIRFNMDYNTSFTVESGNILSLPLDFFTPDVTTNSEAEFASNDTRKDKIQEIKLTSLVLKTKESSGANFDFLKHVYLYIKADGVDEKRYAFKENVANGVSVINLEVVDVNLAEYIKQDAFSLRAECVTDKTLSQDLEVDAEMVFAVKANPLK